MSWRREMACEMLPSKAVGSVGTFGTLGTVGSDGTPLGRGSPVDTGRPLGIGRPEVGRDTGGKGGTPSELVGTGTGRLTGTEGVPTLGRPGTVKASAAVASAAKKTRLGRILADSRSWFE